MFTAYKGEHHIPANGNNQLVFKVQRVAAAQRKDDFQTDIVYSHIQTHLRTSFAHCDVPTPRINVEIRTVVSQPPRQRQLTRGRASVSGHAQCLDAHSISRRRWRPRPLNERHSARWFLCQRRTPSLSSSSSSSSSWRRCVVALRRCVGRFASPPPPPPPRGRLLWTETERQTTATYVFVSRR